MQHHLALGFLEGMTPKMCLEKKWEVIGIIFAEWGWAEGLEQQWLMKRGKSIVNWQQDYVNREL